MAFSSEAARKTFIFFIFTFYLQAPELLRQLQIKKENFETR